MKGPGVQVASQKEYDDLQVEMNLYYHDVNLDPQAVKLSSLKKGQVRWSCFLNKYHSACLLQHIHYL